MRPAMQADLPARIQQDPQFVVIQAFVNPTARRPPPPNATYPPTDCVGGPKAADGVVQSGSDGTLPRRKSGS